jgi:sigma-B regulation protein RsbU (phosphoserine phosphatase)
MNATAKWTNRFPATLRGVAGAAAWLETVAAAEGFPEELTFNIQLCVEELFTNVVRHGGGLWEEADSSDVGMAVSIARAGAEVTVLLEDNGSPFDTAAAEARPAEGNIENTEPGGLGIKLVREFSSGLTYSREGGLNRTTLKFLWPNSAFSLQ